MGTSPAVFNVSKAGRSPNALKVLKPLAGGAHANCTQLPGHLGPAASGYKC